MSWHYVLLGTCFNGLLANHTIWHCKVTVSIKGIVIFPHWNTRSFNCDSILRKRDGSRFTTFVLNGGNCLPPSSHHSISNVSRDKQNVALVGCISWHHLRRNLHPHWNIGNHALNILWIHTTQIVCVIIMPNKWRAWRYILGKKQHETVWGAL